LLQYDAIDGWKVNLIHIIIPKNVFISTMSVSTHSLSLDFGRWAKAYKLLPYLFVSITNKFKTLSSTNKQKKSYGDLLVSVSIISGLIPKGSSFGLKTGHEVSARPQVDGIWVGKILIFGSCGKLLSSSSLEKKMLESCILILYYRIDLRINYGFFNFFECENLWIVNNNNNNIPKCSRGLHQNHRQSQINHHQMTY